VAVERGCYPGVCQLQQRSPSGSQKQGRLAIHLPADGGWSEDAGVRIGCSIADRIPEALDLASRDGLIFTVHALKSS
jgi:hypothetical protein